MLSREDRRRQILETAGQLFLAQGFNATSMQDIAKQAEISRASLYTYFGNQDEVFLGALFAFFDNILQAAEAALTQLPDTASLQEKLYAILNIRQTMWFALETQQSPHAMELLELQQRALRDAESYPFERLLVEAIDDALATGQITAPPSLSKESIADMLNLSTTAIVFVEGSREQKSARLNTLLRLFVGGLQTEGALQGQRSH